MYRTIIMLSICVFAITKNLFSQSKNTGSKGIVFGTSFYYFTETEEGPSRLTVYRQATWNLNAAIYVCKNVRVGVTSLQVFEENLPEEWENFFMFGPMVQYEFFIPKTRSPIVLEAGLFIANFAPVTGDLIERKSTYFLNTGLSYEQFLTPHIFIELGVNYYPVLGKIRNKENFVVPVIGINYFLGKR